jgi:RHS repeat-associated protein
MYFRNRMYSVELGRSIGRDPWRGDPKRANAMDGYANGLNLYEYVAAQPSRFVDPEGLEITKTVDTVTMLHPKGDNSEVNWDAGAKEKVNRASIAAAGAFIAKEGTYTENVDNSFGITTYEFTAKIKCICNDDSQAVPKKWYAAVLLHAVDLHYGNDRDENRDEHDVFRTIEHEKIHVWRAYEKWNRWDVMEFLVTHGYKTKQGGPDKSFDSRDECMGDVEFALMGYENEIYVEVRNTHVQPDFHNKHEPTPWAMRQVNTQVPWNGR